MFGINKRATVEEVHNDFYSEVDRLSEQAQQKHSLETDKQKLIEKKERLEKLGFSNTKEVQEASKEIKRLDELEQKNKQKQHLTEAINYCKQKYPHYKFITERSVKDICAKYGLVYGSVDKYTGTVPDRNLEQMERFEIKPDDIAYKHEEYILNLYRSSSDLFYRDILNKQEYEKVLESLRKDDVHRKVDGKGLWRRDHVTVIVRQCPLTIAAPVEDFNTENMEIENFELKEKPPEGDPVVLQPVYFKGHKHYLIVTAWGEEAVDVVNEKMN